MEQRLDALADDVRAERVGTVEVLRIPDNLLFEIRVAPETIEQVWQTKFTVHQLAVPALQKVVRALKNAKAPQVADSSDLR